MTLLVPWLVFPVLLGLLALGCGLLLEQVGRLRLPGALLLPAGLAVIIVLGNLTTASDATAELTVPLVVALSVAGLCVAPPWRRARLEPWLAAAAVVVFAIYAAPVVLSGDPTFTGYVRLDDTATWLALTDRVMDHARDLSGLQPSSYEATLDVYNEGGYPVGAFLPVGIGHAIFGTDIAWLYQPCMSFYAAMLALALGELAGPLVPGARARAVVAAIAAQPAVLFGYVMWGGIKEAAAAAMLALVAATVPLALGAGGVALIIPLAVACAALLAILSLAGMIWLGPLLLAALALAARRLDARLTVRRVLWFAAAIALLSLPLINSSALDVVTNSELHSQDELGNLFEPLSGFQIVGIWPVGDFRSSPGEGGVTALLIALALLAAAAGIFAAIRARAFALLLYCLGGCAAAVVIVFGGSPWIDAKALATISPAVLLAAMAGAVWIYGSGRAVGGALLASLIAIGVVWSNILAYGEVSLAPYDQLSELEEIGEQIEGQGPTLMTDYQAYGVRHFLRDADPEGVSELRRRPIPLRGGGEVAKGEGADTDELQLDGLLVYRTLVLRRSPEQSRPPSPYQLIERGEFYDVWQRDPAASTSGLRHLPLGSGVEPTATPDCADVRRFAEAAGPAGSVAYVSRPPNVVFLLSEFEHPPDWTDPSSDKLLPDSEGTAALRIQLPAAGRWQVWLGGSVPGEVDLLVDGQKVGSTRQRLNYGYYMDLGQLDLTSSSHLVELRFHGSDLHPGSANPAAPVGPLVFSSAEAADEIVEYLPSSRAEDLCGRRLDWIEALPG